MALGVTLPTNTNIVQFPPEAIVQADKEKMDNLGQQISAIVQNYNTLKQELVTDGNADRKAQFVALLDQRRQAIESAMDAWKQKQTQLKIVSNTQVPMLQGLGQVDLSSLQTQISTEQSKLTALQTYYAAYKLAIENGQIPPAMPPELQSDGFLGFSTTTLIAIAALLAAGWFLFMKK